MKQVCFQVGCRRDGYTDSWFRGSLGLMIKRATEAEVTLLTQAERFVLNTLMSEEKWQEFSNSPEYAAIIREIDVYGDCYYGCIRAESL